MNRQPATPSAATIDPVGVVRAVYAALEREDERTLHRLLAPDLEAFAPNALPWGGYYTGTSGFADLLRRKLETVDAGLEPSQWIAAGERVVVVARAKGCCRTTHRPLDLALVHVWTVRGGRIASVECYADASAVATARAAGDEAATVQSAAAPAPSTTGART